MTEAGRDNVGQPGPGQQLTKFACLDCRRVFKRPVEDIGKRSAPRPIEIRRCPGCGGDAYLMGSDFRAPPRDDRKAWDVVSVLVRAGLPYFRVYQTMPIAELAASGIPTKGVLAASYRVGEYPTTMAEAHAFVALHGNLAMPFVRPEKR